jgi:hypothetical protein
MHNMRVDYTIQGMQPPVDPRMVRAANAGGPYGPTFGERLRRFTANFRLNWRQVLGLDQVPPGPTTLGPPPKPATLETRDPGEVRQQWRRLAGRSSRMLAESPPGDTGTNALSPKTRRMHALLAQMQEMEDGVVSRSLSATRG